MKKWLLLLLLASPAAAVRGMPRSTESGLDVLSAPSTTTLSTLQIAAHSAPLSATPTPQSLGLARLPPLRMVYSQTVRGQHGLHDRTYVGYVQTYNDVDVAGTYLTIAYTPGAAATVSSSLYAGLAQVDRGPNDWNASAERIKHRADSTKIQKRDRKVRWLGGRWREVYEFNVTDRGLHGAVDGAGQTYLWDERYFITHEGTVRGRRVDFDPVATGAGLSTTPMALLSVTDSNGASTLTNSNGGYSLTTPSSADLPQYLFGQWVTVYDKLNAPLTATISGAAPNPVDLLFNPTDNLDTKTTQVNVFTHLTYEHDWVAARGVDPTGIDISLPAYVNDSQYFTCNAYYGGGNVHFFVSDLGCINSGYDTVAYHEYGHFIDDMIGGIVSSQLSEGWGDIMATYITGQPLVGEGFRGYGGSFIRNAANDYIYNPQDVDPHQVGEAWMGFAWDLRTSLIALFGSSDGASLAESLIIPVFLANSPDIPSAVQEVARRDSPDGQLKNGPHFAQILAAAKHHGLGFTFDTDAPTPPGHVTLSQVTAHAFMLSWTASTDDVGVVGYVQDISTDSDFQTLLTSYTFVMTGTHSAYIEPLKAATAYYVRMRAYDQANNISANSETATATTLPETRQGGIVLALRAGSTTPYLSQSGILFSPDIYFNDGQAYTNGAYTLGTDDPKLYESERANFVPNHFTYDIPLPNGAYHVKILFNTWYAGPWGNQSDLILGTTRIVHQLDVPARLHTAATYSAFDLTYGTVVTGENLHLEMLPLLGIPGISGLIVSTATVNTVAPTAPPALSFSGTDFHGTKLSWDASQDDEQVTGYRLDLSTAADFSTSASSYTDRDVGNALSFAPNDLRPSTLYYVRVRSYDEWLNFSPYMAGSFVTAADTTPPTAPLYPYISVFSSGSIQASWSRSTDDSGVAGYRFDLSSSPTFETFVAGYQNKDVGIATSALVGGLQPATTYYLRVRAYDTSGNVSSDSEVGQGTTLPRPPPPVITITTPVNGATISGSVLVSGTAIAPPLTNIQLIAVTVDGIDQGAITGTNSWSFNLSAGLLPAGNHTLTATAVTTSGDSASAEITVTVHNDNPVVYSSIYGTPLCAAAQASCDSLDLERVGAPYRVELNRMHPIRFMEVAAMEVPASIIEMNHSRN